MGKDRKGMKYNILSVEQRAVIWNMKQQGISCLEISEQLGLNYKTIQSVNNEQKNQEYLPLMSKVEQMAYESIVGRVNYKNLNEKQLSKIVRKIGKEQCGPNSQFISLIPKNKKDSQKRRIIQQIVNNVVRKITNNQLSKDQLSRLDDYIPDSFQGSMQVDGDHIFTEEVMTIEPNSRAEVSSYIYLNSDYEFEQMQDGPSSQEQVQNEYEVQFDQISYRYL